jgi:serine/threonine-protein kinase
MRAIPENIGPYLYKPSELIRETRMSLVWSATLTGAKIGDPDAQPDEVVLKIARMSEKNYSLANQRAIENEEDWLRRLQHPGIVKLRAIAEERPTRQSVYRARTNLAHQPWFLVMDYLPGGTLTQLIEERKQLSIALSLHIAHHVAQALAHSHSIGCVHRDIKPNNILFREKPHLHHLDSAAHPIVIDFGIAASRGKPGRVSGTQAWMAPEAEAAMRQGKELAADPSWDMYALGLVLYNMVTGKRPPMSVPHVYKLVRIKTALVREDSSVPRPAVKALTTGLNGLIAACVDNDPNKRPTASQFAAQTQQLLALTQPEPEMVRRWFTPMSIAGGLSVAIVATLLVLINAPGTEIGMGEEQADVMPVPVVDVATDGAIQAPAVREDAGNDALATGLATSGGETATAIATVTAVATHTPPATPTPTAVVRTPTSTPLEIAQGSIAGEETAGNTAQAATATAVPTRTRSSTSTPLPTSTATPIPSPTASATPRATATATATRTATPEPTAPLAPTDGPAVPPPTLQSRRVRLLHPPEGSTWGHEKVEFRWEPTFTLRPGEFFEVVLSQPGQDPFRRSYAVHGPTQEHQIMVTFSAALEDAVRNAIGRDFLQPGEFQWSVLVVRTQPNYQRIESVSASRRFIYAPQ